MSDTGVHHGSSPSRPTSPSQMLDPMPEVAQQFSLLTAIHTVGIIAKANKAQNLLNRAVESDMEPNEFLLSLREIGIIANEATDYVDEYEQRMEIKRGKGRATSSPNEPSGDKRLAEIKCNEVVKHIDDAAWAALCAKLKSTGQHQPQKSLERCVRIDIDSDNEQEDHGSVPSFSKAVLALAPHLGNLSLSSIVSDPIFEKSHCLKAAYTSEKSINLLIDRAQLEQLMDPISQSVWKKIILDRYVDFEHLYATFEKGYNHIDKSKVFNEEFTIIKKDSLTKKKSVLSESNWLCLFDAWRAAVLVFYHHWEDKISVYREYMVKIFCSSPSPSSAILFDHEVREVYSPGISKCLNILQVDLL
ncbi:hypothetical protein H0H87_002646 [Tephrocybe sp. NHM501043]|nr:hypothetical protein H0H87_002646 [Tephrocybe sp. NHM501043]